MRSSEFLGYIRSFVSNSIIHRQIQAHSLLRVRWQYGIAIGIPIRLASIGGFFRLWALASSSCILWFGVGYRTIRFALAHNSQLARQSPPPPVGRSAPALPLHACCGRAAPPSRGRVRRQASQVSALTAPHIAPHIRTRARRVSGISVRPHCALRLPVIRVSWLSPRAPRARHTRPRGGADRAGTGPGAAAWGVGSGDRSLLPSCKSRLER